jgi:hypothetical protein
MYYHIQLVNFVCHDIHRSLILIIVIKTAPFLYFLIRPNVYIFNAPLNCYLSPHFIEIRPHIGYTHDQKNGNQKCKRRASSGKTPTI